MSNEIKNMVAVELSEDELDTVAGGFGISIGDGQNLALDTTSSFKQSNLGVAQQTMAGPTGAGTTTQVMAQDIFSNAGQGLGVGN
ncbi:MAG: CTB family bacteriocin [Rivularia sp. (in: cyanobacteria)]